MASDEELDNGSEPGEEEGCDNGEKQLASLLGARQQQQHTLPLLDNNATTAASKPKKKKSGKKLPPIRINLANCKYEVLRVVQRKLGWKEVGDDEEWEIYWTDTSVSIERVMKLSKTQKINHFNGMLEICRKKSMARNLSKMAKLFPEHYDFFPRTFLLPNDLQDLLADVKARGKKQIYILKPDAGCQGRGIRLIQGGKEEAVVKLLKEMDQPNVVAQHYLTKPLLVNGYKFDMRIYALVLSCDPLRTFIFEEGLARFCTEKYTKPKPENLGLAYMHLTNYAVNKHNENFVAAQSKEGNSAEDASKWTLAQLAKHMKSQIYPGYNCCTHTDACKQGHDWDRVWERVQQLIVKSLISVQPVLRNNYRSVLPPDNDGFSCFEILGYDIMLDSELKPWLLEVNHSPSFNIDSPLDLAVKEQLITDTIQLARIDPKLIAKAKKADKRAAAGRLLEPLQKKKEAPGAIGAPFGSGAGLAPSQQAAPVQAQAQGQGTAGLPGTASSAPASSGVAEEASSLNPCKPRTAEEYEAMRAEVMRKRERYEAKHSGGFSRIYPTNDRTLQGLYEELLRGAAEVFQSTFQAKAKKALDTLNEDRRRKAEDAETDSVKAAEKAKAKALRDKLAQQALERRAKKEMERAAAAAAAGHLPMAPGMFGNGQIMPPLGMAMSGNSIQAPIVTSGWVLGPNGMMYLQHGTNAVNSAFYSSGTGAHGLMRSSLGNRLSNGSALQVYGQYSSGLYTGSTGSGMCEDESGMMVAIAGAQPRSEIWGESEAGDISFSRGSGYSPVNSAPSSRPQSARSMSDPVTIISREGMRLRQHSPALPRGLPNGNTGSSSSTTPSNNQQHQQQQGPLGPQPFRTSPLRQLPGGDSGSGGTDQGWQPGQLPPPAPSGSSSFPTLLTALRPGSGGTAAAAAGGGHLPGLPPALPHPHLSTTGQQQQQQPPSDTPRPVTGGTPAEDVITSRSSTGVSPAHRPGSQPQQQQPQQQQQQGVVGIPGAGAGTTTTTTTTTVLAPRDMSFPYPRPPSASAGSRPGSASSHSTTSTAALLQSAATATLAAAAALEQQYYQQYGPTLEPSSPHPFSWRSGPLHSPSAPSASPGAHNTAAGGGYPVTPPFIGLSHSSGASAPPGSAGPSTPSRRAAAAISVHEVSPSWDEKGGWSANLGTSHGILPFHSPSNPHSHSQPQHSYHHSHHPPQSGGGRPLSAGSSGRVIRSVPRAELRTGVGGDGRSPSISIVGPSLWRTLSSGTHPLPSSHSAGSHAVNSASTQAHPADGLSLWAATAGQQQGSGENLLQGRSSQPALQGGGPGGRATHGEHMPSPSPLASYTQGPGSRSATPPLQLTHNQQQQQGQQGSLDALAAAAVAIASDIGSAPSTPSCGITSPFHDSRSGVSTAAGSRRPGSVAGATSIYIASPPTPTPSPGGLTASTLPPYVLQGGLMGSSGAGGGLGFVIRPVLALGKSAPPKGGSLYKSLRPVVPGSPAGVKSRLDTASSGARLAVLGRRVAAEGDA